MPLETMLLIVGQALDALEPDATEQQRRDAWNALRDEFFPLNMTIELPQPPAPQPAEPRHRTARELLQMWQPPPPELVAALDVAVEAFSEPSEPERCQEQVQVWFKGDHSRGLCNEPIPCYRHPQPPEPAK